MNLKILLVIFWCLFVVLIVADQQHQQQHHHHHHHHQNHDLDNIPENEIIVLNSGIKVSFGRAVFLDPDRHLKIQVQPGHRCMVRVIRNDPLSQRPGRLGPTEFPCKFGAHDVQYSHFGDRTLTEDRVSLLLRYDTEEDTLIIPFAVRVQVNFDQLEVVTRYMPITVDKLRGQSNPIDHRTLQFTYDKETQMCQISVLHGSDIKLPRYGQLVNYDVGVDRSSDEDHDSSFVDCDSFVQNDIRYRHTANDGRSSNRDSVPMVVELRDRGGNLIKQEYFQLTVRIKEAQENTAPKVSFSSLLLMDVSQFVMTPITTDILTAQDSETVSDDLVFNITSPLGFGDGHILSTDDQNLPIRSFTQKDIEELKIAYKPPSSDGDVRRIFPIIMEVVDSGGLRSEPFTLLITVNPMNSKAPVVTRNTGISLFEGQSRRLHSFKNLEISDEDNMDDVVVSVVDGLRHGQLLLMDAQVKQFTPADLDAGLIRYQHDGSDTFNDNILFSMSDGKHDVQFLFPINIFPEDDEPPVLTVNTGLVLQKSVEEEISPFEMSAADVDSDDDVIRYVLEDHSPLYGEIILKRDTVPPDESEDSWNVQDGLYEKRATEWTQQDLVEGRVFYRHMGEHHTQTVMDAVTFRLKDDSDPPNVSRVKQFLVKILPLDDIPPELYHGTPLHMIVDEFQMKEFTRSQLRYTDTDSDDRLLRYTVVRPPYDLDDNSQAEAGQLVLSEDPDVRVSTFTQAQVNHHKIAYRPPPVELGLARRMIQFEFKVEDEAGNLLPDQLFTIVLQPIDNKPPQVFNSGFRVFENGFAQIDSSVLDATDSDTDAQQLIFRVTEIPRYGTLQRHMRSLEVGEEFGREDLTSGALTYVNNGAEKREDEFQLEVTDGAHIVPATVHVTIRPVDDETPKLLTEEPGTLGLQMDVFEGGNTALDSKVLQASDPDTEDMKLTFVLEMPPHFGELRINNRRVDRFNQDQLRKGIVKYHHTGGEIGHWSVEDTFNLSLTDLSSEWNVAGNRVSQIQVNVTVEPKDTMLPNVSIASYLVVIEGQKQTLTTAHITVTDVDSKEEDIVCTLLMQPAQGYIENIEPLSGSEKSRAGIPVTAFRVMDLQRRTLNYVQSIHRGMEPREDRFVFQCSDGVNVSPRLSMPVVIEPTNDERPQMIVGDFSVLEGMHLPFDHTILNAVDMDKPRDQLVFRITRKPKHGKIILQSLDGDIEIEQFYVDQINSSNLDPVIGYLHDDSETQMDEFEVELLDGHPNHTVKQVVNVVIFPTDDETPRLTVNGGLEVDIGETVAITNRVLKAEDVDSEDVFLVYIVRSPPRHGTLVRVNPLSGELLTNITKGRNFTQGDIDQQIIHYVHGGRDGGRDVIKFDITDGTNILIDLQFYVAVEGLDLVYPDIINKGVELPEGGRITLTTDILSTSDLNSDDELLTFTVTRAPVKGHLENSGQPGMPIATFTQLELAGNKIYYVHTSGDEIKMDSFEFEVTDGFNSVFRTFRISLSDVDNKKPILFLNKVIVREGGHRLLSPFELKIEDRDTSDQFLRFMVTQVPIHGVLYYNRTRPVSVFTMADLEDNLISYSHDGSETLKDSFSLVISDGTHVSYFVHPKLDRETRRPQTIEIDVVPVDNGIPQIVINKGASTVGPLDSTLNGAIGFQFTNKILKSEDRDSSDVQLMYVVSALPRNGFLVNRALNNVSITNFTQGDLDNQDILYVLHKGNNATNDVFTFKVVDSGGNELVDQIFRLNWAWISFEYESYIVNETEMFLRINLRRRGYLGETSFVGLTTVDLSAKKGKDFHKSYAKQVQFNPGQYEAMWRVRILQDNEYERNEQFQITLEEPIMAALEFPDSALVTISDQEDESVIFFPIQTMEVEENVGELNIAISRTGDLSEELMVLCSTESGTAIGTIPSTLLSYSDYISRPAVHTSAVHFDRLQESAFCRIIIIDDSLMENDEQFRVVLSMPIGGTIGSFNELTMTILADPNDSPSVYFGQSSYSVDESDGYLEVTVLRAGTDLSKESVVVVQSRPSDPISAKSGQDYLGIGRNLEFGPGVTLQTFRVTVVDDLGRPRLEGLESFELLLRMPTNAILGEPSRASVVINDSVSDMPSMQFRDAVHNVLESDGKVVAMITRSGDISQSSAVRCYTRQNTARVQLDFEELPDTNASIITFSSGEVEKPCIVHLVDDDIHEPDEDFRLVLGSAESETAGGARIGMWNFTRIIISDSSDKPIIKFEKTRLNAREPKSHSDVNIIEVPVIRIGDLSRLSIVRIHTKDGSAKSGEDYHGLSKELRFATNVSQLMVPVEILYNEEKEHREAFTIHIKPDKNMIAEIKDFKAIIYIQEDDIIADVTFPSPPMVVSLRDYDNAESAAPFPIPGYPVVCITSCNPKHPDFIKTGTLCAKEGLNDSLTEFRWRIATPSGSDGVTYDLNDLESNIFFSSTKQITLDSIYFNAGSRIQCAARAVNLEGDPGLELLSPIVTVSTKEGICLPRIMGSFGAEPFTAKLRYTGPDDREHPNLVKLSVVIPHRDGMLPVVSTSPLDNFELTLSPHGARIGSHKCSNLLDANEVTTKYGFITPATINPEMIGEVEPYQYNDGLRSKPTLRFYRNLDLESCMWEFVSYYDMSELVNECGGTIDTDGQVLNLVQSHVSVRVPLFVSYVFHSPMTTGGWQHNDLTSQLRLTFVYDTSILWQHGIGAPEESQLQGHLYPTSMKIRDDGCLVVNFRTEARFRGQFVLSHPGSVETSMVMSPEYSELTFDLDLVRSEPTFSQPQQEWMFVSDHAVRDYSGIYHIKLMPCTVSPDVSYSTPIVCNPREPIDFELQIRFQQVSDPVAARYSLNTQFHLMRKKNLWLSDEKMGLEEDLDVSFQPGDMIYGRIVVDSVQNLGTSFFIVLEKCFLCTGVDGYIPKYDPLHNEYGCVANSQSLLFSFKLIDKEVPSSVQKEFRNVPFNAILASDDEDIEVEALIQQPGSDGFRLDSAPLFQVERGRQWFIHCIYTVRSRDNTGRGIVKRSVEKKHHSFVSMRSRRSLDDVEGIGNDGRGTNMHSILLNYDGMDGGTTADTSVNKDRDGIVAVGKRLAEINVIKTLVPMFMGLVIFLLVIVLVTLTVIRCKMKKRDGSSESRSNGNCGVSDQKKNDSFKLNKSALMTVIDTKGSASTIIVSNTCQDNTEV